MPKLPEDFPHRAALEAAGEGTMAKVRKRIAADSLQEIEGIGPASEKDIIEAFEKIDSPDEQAKDMQASEDDATLPSDHLDNAINKPNSQDASAGASAATGETIVSDGPPSPEALQKGQEEAEKSGAQKNAELPNHDLSDISPAEAGRNAAFASDGERLAHSGAVVVDDPRGPYVSKTAVRIGPEEGRIKVLPVGQTSPEKGMEIRDGADVYVLDDSYRKDSQPHDWLRVRSPNTGRPLID